MQRRYRCHRARLGTYYVIGRKQQGFCHLHQSRLNLRRAPQITWRSEDGLLCATLNMLTVHLAELMQQRWLYAGPTLQAFTRLTASVGPWTSANWTLVSKRGREMLRFSHQVHSVVRFLVCSLVTVWLDGEPPKDMPNRTWFDPQICVECNVNLDGNKRAE